MFDDRSLIVHSRGTILSQESVGYVVVGSETGAEYTESRVSRDDGVGWARSSCTSLLCGRLRRNNVTECVIHKMHFHSLQLTCTWHIFALAHAECAIRLPARLSIAFNADALSRNSRRRRRLRTTARIGRRLAPIAPTAIDYKEGKCP